jgi:ATP-dependent DNA ligase
VTFVPGVLAPVELEGIVSKRIDTPYRPEPFLVWRKIKCPGYVRPQTIGRI